MIVWPSALHLPRMIICVLLLPVGLLLTHRPAQGEEDIAAIIEKRCGQEQVPADLRFDVMQDSKAVCAVYERLSWAPLWINNHSRLHDALHAVYQSSSHGIDPERYHVGELMALHEKTGLDDRLLFEFTLTRALAQLLVDARTGCREARHLEDPVGDASINREDIGLDQLMGVAHAPHLRRAVEEAYPRGRAYQNLRSAFILAGKTREFSPLTLPGTLRKGDTSPLLPKVRERLAQLGFPALVGEKSELLSETDEETIRQFQLAHGLTPDGTLGRKTLAELNHQPALRAETVQVNLERLRWEDEANHPPLLVEVNIADFRLTLYESGTPVLSMPVIIGKPETPTALFRASITGVTFNPWWRVPTSIVRNELLSQLRKDPRRALAQGMEVRFRDDGSSAPLDVSAIDWHHIPYSMASRIAMQQQPGPHNPLGTLKFEMPNPHTIYLHDTPSKGLFSKTTRAFSHGCIRLADPKGLAVALLKGADPHWGQTEIAEAIESHRTRTVRVRPPVPVRTVYRTAWVDGNGRLQWRPDLYRLDEALLQTRCLRSHVRRSSSTKRTPLVNSRTGNMPTTERQN